MSENSKAFYYEDTLGLFRAMWTPSPRFPGHTLLIPTRHFALFREMTKKEMRYIAFVVAEVKNKIEQTNLQTVCDNLVAISDESSKRIAKFGSSSNSTTTSRQKRLMMASMMAALPAKLFRTFTST